MRRSKGFTLLEMLIAMLIIGTLGAIVLPRMNANGTNQTRLTNNPADDYDPSWSP